MHRGMQPDSFTETTAILDQAAALAENSAIQQEITLHSHRQFVLQVCSAPLPPNQNIAPLRLMLCALRAEQQME